jgi:hypothetical protein
MLCNKPHSTELYYYYCYFERVNTIYEIAMSKYNFEIALATHTNSIHHYESRIVEITIDYSTLKKYL